MNDLPDNFEKCESEYNKHYDPCDDIPDEEYNEKLKEIEEYCRPHKAHMWAATILGIIQECDFRDAR